jgi:hypothetical protein
MPVVKLSHPLNWFKHGHWGYENHFPGNHPTWGNFQFEINNDTAECDFWVVHESVDRRETVKCPRQNVILITSEEKQQVPNYSNPYLRQFSKIITSRDDIDHPNVERSFYFSPWRVRKTFDEIKNVRPSKSEVFSAIISNNVSTPGHLQRYAFVNKLKGHFKDKMVWFGKGEKEITDKWDGLVNFKYSLAMENCSTPYYFTEKILDCYCAFTMPVYWGCPSISKYFPDQSYLPIDILDYKASIRTIEQAIAENFFERNEDGLEKARRLVLDKYQFIAAVSHLLQTLTPRVDNLKKSITLQPKDAFERAPYSRILGRLKKLM